MQPSWTGASRTPSVLAAAARGAAAALGGLAVAELLAVAQRSPSLVDGAARLVVDHGPRPLVDLTVRLLVDRDKLALRTGVTATVLGLGVLVSTRPRRLSRDLLTTGSLAAVAARLAVRRPPRSRRASAVAALAGAATSTALLAAPPARTPATVLAGATGLTLARAWQRRRLAVHGRVVAGQRLTVARPLAAASDGARWPGATPLLTRIDELFQTDVNLGSPGIDPADWRLRITGSVARPLELTWDDLCRWGLREFDSTLVCIHRTEHVDRVGTVRWAGLPLLDLVARAQPSAAAQTLITRAVDGFTISFPLQLLRSAPAYLVLGADGRALPAAHGFPARVLVPGLYGQYAGVKWLTELELSERPHADYCVRRGWPRGPVPIRPASRFDPLPADRLRPGPVTLTGVAWAPPSGVAGVEIATGDGAWQVADLAESLGPYVWRRWRVILDLPAGTHHVVARVVAADGTIQDGERRPPFPTGASGYPRLTVGVADS